jgi:hypothetical protein
MGINSKRAPTMKAKILITSIDNMKLFRGKMPTQRWGFCEIVRMVTIEPCPHGVYEDGNYGYVKIDGKKVRVINGNGGETLFEISQ